MSALDNLGALGAGGGGGGGGVETCTVTDRVSLPPGPRAVKVYVVLSIGKTCRWPWLWTAPMPWLMDMSVALLMDQRRVADWPRSMVVGSTVKLLITAASTRGGGAGAGAGGGGGGGGGTFLPQADTKTISTNVSASAPVLEACNLELSLIRTISSPEQELWFIALLYSKRASRCCLVL
jgi:hypothetical protein